MYVSGRTTKAPREGYAVRNADAFGYIYGPSLAPEENWGRLAGESIGDFDRLGITGGLLFAL